MSQVTLVKSQDALWRNRGSEANSVEGDFELSHFRRVSGRRDSREWVFLAFVDAEADGAFGGWIIDPLPVRVRDGGLVVG